MLERNDEIRQFPMQASTLGTHQTSDTQAFALAIRLPEGPDDPVPMQQLATTNRAGDVLPAPDEKYRTVL